MKIVSILFIYIFATSCALMNKSNVIDLQLKGFVFLKAINEEKIIPTSGLLRIQGENFKFVSDSKNIAPQKKTSLLTSGLTIPIKSIKEITLIDSLYENQVKFKFKIGNTFMKFSSENSKLFVDEILKRQVK